MKEKNAAIEKIEKRKDAEIEELTAKHAKKYEEIKTFYNEITTTNIDIIRSQTSELETLRKTFQQKEVQRNKKEKENANIVGPLEAAKARNMELAEETIKHQIVDKELGLVQEDITKYMKIVKELEW